MHCLHPLQWCQNDVGCGVWEHVELADERAVLHGDGPVGKSRSRVFHVRSACARLAEMKENLHDARRVSEIPGR